MVETCNPKSDITVLIADDHPMVREGLRSMLNAPGLTVIGEAGSGHEAIAQAKALLPDVVLMDIRMPDMDGIAALEGIKEALLPSRVIMVTTYRNTAYLLRALAAGADGFVLKDIPRNDLLATIHAIAAGAARVDQQFLQQVLRDLAETDQAGVIDTELVEPLTPREMDVLRLLVEGLTNQAIGHALGLSPGTVKGYVQSLTQKLDAADRTQAAVKAIRLGLLK